MDRPLRLFAVWALAIALLARHARHFDHVVDDAFISFRYLENLRAGDGLVYNPGERVEGYTNFLWIMMLLPGTGLGLDVAPLAAYLGVACMAGAIAVRWRLDAATSSAPVGSRWLGAGLLCASAPVAYWAGGGLETGLFCLLVVTLLGLVQRCGRPAIDVGAGVVAALLCMTRPDGVVFIAAAALWLVAFDPAGTGPGARRAALIRLLASFALVYGPYFLWRWSYYDALLPNTFYAKVGGGTAAFRRGLMYVGAFVAVSGAGLVLAVGGLTALVRAMRRAAPRVPDALGASGLVLLFTGAGVVFVVLVGGDQLAMFRFMVPVLVIALPSAARQLPGRAAGLVAAAVAACSLAVTLGPTFAGPMYRRVVQSERPADADRATIGKWLREHRSAETLIAVVPAGVLPFYAGLPTLDLVGLNDRHIARADVPHVGRGAPGHERYDVAYVMERRPDLVFLGACRLWDRPLSAKELDAYVRRYAALAPGVGALLDHAPFRAAYAPTALPIAGRYAHVWVRRDAAGNP